MYTKKINGRDVFSDCKTIQLEFDHPPLRKGQYVSNPSLDLIHEDGWQEYIPPVPEIIPQTEPGTLQVLSAVKQMLSKSVESLTDEEALEIAALYPTWSSKIGKQVNSGERYWYNGNLWKVIQSHTVQEDWTPDVSVSLFVKVSIEEWPEWRQPTGAQDAYMAGDKVTFEGTHYICTMDYNIYSPEEYPQGWEARQ